MSLSSVFSIKIFHVDPSDEPFKLVDPYALAWLYLLTFKKKLTSLSCNRTINHLTMTPRFWEALSRLHFASFFLAVLRGEWLLSQLFQHHIPLLTTWSFSLLFLVVYFVPSVSNIIVPALQPLFATFFIIIYVGVRTSLRAPRLITRPIEHPANPVSM